MIENAKLNTDCLIRSRSGEGIIKAGTLMRMRDRGRLVGNLLEVIYAFVVECPGKD